MHRWFRLRRVSTLQFLPTGLSRHTLQQQSRQCTRPTPTKHRFERRSTNPTLCWRPPLKEISITVAAGGQSRELLLYNTAVWRIR